MYENDNLNPLNENINNATDEVQDEVQAEPVASIEPKAEPAQESVTTGFVMVETPVREEAVTTATAGQAPVDNQTTDNADEHQAVYASPNTQGAFSGQAQQTYTAAPSSSGPQPYSARDIKPRKKMGLGKRIAVLCLSGLLLGSCAAGAYLGVTYLADRLGFNKPAIEVEQTTPSEAITKEPEIKETEIVTPVQSGNVGVSVLWDVSNVVDEVMPAMVSVINKYTETISSFWGQSYTQEGASSGSGIVIGENETELLIATNYHVVSGSNTIEITFIDEAVATAYIKGTNPDMDLAVVAVMLDSLSAETKEAIAVASLGNSDNLRLGEPVIAIGNALGYGQSVTTGVVSAIDREIASEDGATGSFIQTDAAINPGNSGGALLNMQGQVIGINSSKIGGSTIEGMGFAIPISAAEPIISDLSLQTTKIKVEEAERGYLGVSIAEMSSSYAQMYGMPQGVLIAEVVKDGAADAAGMRRYDIIVSFDTFKISSYSDLQDAMQYYAAGTTVPVEVMRLQNGEYASVMLEVTLGERPAQ